MITLLVVCCISMVSSAFRAIPCSEIMRFRAQLRPVQNYTFFKASAVRTHPRPLILVNKLWASVCGSLKLLQIRARKQTAFCSLHICDSDALPPTRPGQFTCHPTSANRLLRWTAVNRRHSGWSGPLGTQSPPATYDVCRHVLPGKMRELRHGTCRRTGFQLPISLRTVNRMFSFAAFFTARLTLCVIRYDHFAMKLDQMSRSWNLIIGYALWYPMLEFVNDVRLIEHRFTSLNSSQCRHLTIAVK